MTGTSTMRRAAIAATVLLLAGLPSSTFAFWPGFPFAPTGESAMKGIPVGPVTLCQKTIRAAGIAVPVFIPGRCRDTQPPPPPPPAAPTVDLSAASTSITIGSSTALVWNSTNAASCTASGGWSGSKAPNGTEPISPATTTAYSIACFGAGGTTTDSVTVTVVPAPEPEPEPEELTASITATRSVVREGSASEATTTLIWTSTGASSCIASGAPEWAGAKPFNGSETITPTADATYALDCTNGEDDVHVSVSVDFIPEEEPEPDPEGDVVINEIAWAGTIIGTTTNNNAEWIELKNRGGAAVDLAGWTLITTSGAPNIAISDEGCVNTNIPAGGFFLLVRTNDSILGVPADCTYSGALANTGTVLVLSDAATSTIDTVDGVPNWEIGGAPIKGDNTTKDTAQRAADDTWFTAPPTPGA